MLQDLAFGHLDNQYRDHQPRGEDVVVCIRGGSILVRRDRNDVLTLPDFARVSAWSRRWICWALITAAAASLRARTASPL